MLVVSRKLGERIVVPHCQLTATIVSVNGDRVRLGISAGRDSRAPRRDLAPSLPAKAQLPRGKAGRV
jgi:sRNA-binding carbon storage regulator CsrA